MKRYFSDDEPDKDKEYGYDGNDDEGDDVDPGIVIDMDFEDVAMQIDLMHTQIKERLLVQANEIAKKDIFWWFRTPVYKTKVINKIFKKLLAAIYEEEDKK